METSTHIKLVAGVSHRQIPTQHIVTTSGQSTQSRFHRAQSLGGTKAQLERVLCAPAQSLPHVSYVSSSRVEWMEVITSGHFSDILLRVDCGHTKVLAVETFTAAVALNGFFFHSLRAVP